MIRSLMNLDLEGIVIRVLAVIFAMSFHEMAHALMSYAFGDQTARRSGRLSLNPFHHVDWWGLLCLLLFGFGWAKPVPVDPRYYKDPKAGMVWTAFAGPLANFVLSFVCIMFYYMLAALAPAFALTNFFGQFLMQLFSATAAISAGFGVFNLIPIPPLDGAKVFWAFLPDRDYFRFQRPNQWVYFLFILLIVSGVASGPLNMMISTLIGWMSSFWSGIFF